MLNNVFRQKIDVFLPTRLFRDAGSLTATWGYRKKKIAAA